MRVWIDQDLCVGDAICSEIAPDVFVMREDGLAYVAEGGEKGKVFSQYDGNVGGAEGVAVVPEALWEDTIDSAEACPGECIFVEP